MNKMEEIKLELNANQNGSFLMVNKLKKYLVYHLKPFEKFMEINETDSIKIFQNRF